MFGAKQGISVGSWCRQQWYGDSLDERVSEVVVVVVRLCVVKSGQVSIHGRAAGASFPRIPL